LQMLEFFQKLYHCYWIIILLVLRSKTNNIKIVFLLL
jgi:hypothetical protein